MKAVKLKKVVGITLAIILIISICFSSRVDSFAAEVDIPSVEVVSPTDFKLDIDKVFTYYQKSVDENLYKAISSVNGEYLLKVYKDTNTTLFNKTVECINPCMAFAITLGEAGASYPGISMTTVMDFNPSNYQTEIDWIKLSENVEQVDSTWYLANVTANYNQNTNGEAYKIPVSLLQKQTNNTRFEGDMVSSGVGPYQITTTDWTNYNLDSRVNPVDGFRNLFKSIGDNWLKVGVEPISDLTVYAILYSAHCNSTEFDKNLINKINEKRTQDALNYIGYQVYLDIREKAFEDPVCAYDINITKYLRPLENLLEIDFTNYANGDNIVKHCIQYTFYKYYFTGSNITIRESDHVVNDLDYIELSKQVASTFRNSKGVFSYSQAEGNIPEVINGVLIDMPFRDCSSYVSSMMKLIDIKCRHMNSYTIFENPMNWRKVNVNTYRDMELGDVIVREGHTAMLIAKNNTFAYFGDCGSTGGIRATAANGWSKYYPLDDLVSSWSSYTEYVYRAR